MKELNVLKMLKGAIVLSGTEKVAWIDFIFRVNFCDKYVFAVHVIQVRKSKSHELIVNIVIKRSQQLVCSKKNSCQSSRHAELSIQYKFGRGGEWNPISNEHCDRRF